MRNTNCRRLGVNSCAEGDICDCELCASKEGRVFEVTLTFVMGDHWHARDGEIYTYAGRPSDTSGVNGALREHTWTVDTFANALKLKSRLLLLTGVRVTMREK